jgi:adenosylmethionine-8-amino-7-oxononanoate aminotransferase
VFRDAYDPLLMRAHIVDSPDSRLGNEAQALAAMRALLEQRHAQIAALIVEPLIQGAAGMVMHSPDYLRSLRQLCSEFEVHLIADEIAVGCGRTGTFFAWEQVSPRPAGAPSAPRGDQADTLWPDFLLLSKGITGGTLPLSLVLTTDAVFQAFWDEQDVGRGFLHSHSYTGNALACAAASAVLDRFELQDQLQANQAQAALLARAFAPLAEDARLAHLRQRGMVLAFDVKQPGERFAERFHLAARERELLIRPIGATVYLMPPYLIDAGAAQFLFKAVLSTLDEVLRHG